MVSAQFIRDNSPITWEPERVIEELLIRVIAQVREHVPWRPGARELLESLREQGVPSALVTMSWRSFAEAVLDALPDGSFAVVVTGDEVERGKPHPEPYLRAADLLGVSPSDCVALEDSPTGVASAVAAGVPTVAIPHVVAVPEQPGAVQVSSLAGIGVTELAELGRRAISSR
jgi:HAD superfamily hydrolase (TIGR01509 family)